MEEQKALELYNMGADYVILPHFIGGAYVSMILNNIETDSSKVPYQKYKHIEELIRRKKIGHSHPAQV